MNLLRLSQLRSIALTMGCSDSKNKTQQPDDQVYKGTISSKAATSAAYQPEVFTIVPANLCLLVGQSGASAIYFQAGYEVNQVSGCNATLNTQKNMILICNANEDYKVTVIGRQATPRSDCHTKFAFQEVITSQPITEYQPSVQFCQRTN